MKHGPLSEARTFSQAVPRAVSRAVSPEEFKLKSPAAGERDALEPGAVHTPQQIPNCLGVILILLSADPSIQIRRCAPDSG